MTSYSPESDPHASFARGLSEPAAEIVRITPNDAANLATYCKAVRIYVPSSLAEATVRVTASRARTDADVITLKFAPGVTYEPLSVRKIFETGTSAGIEIHGYLV